MGGMVLRRPRAVIPLSLHTPMLEKLNKAHHGFTEIHQGVWLSIFQSGISCKIDQLVENVRCVSSTDHVPPDKPNYDRRHHVGV